MIKLLIFLFPILIFSHDTIHLTKEEENFLKKHHEIVLGGDDYWAPYIISNNNNITGYDKDILEKVNELTGANFVISTDSWTNNLEKAKARLIDGLTTSAKHEEREKYFNFSSAYVKQDIHLLVKHGNPLNIHKEGDLKDKTIVIQKDNLFDKKLAQKLNPKKIIYKDSTRETLHEVIYGKADATIGKGTIKYIKNEKGLPYLNTSFLLDKKLELLFSIRKDWPEAVSILNKGLAAISDNEKEKLEKKWFHENLIDNRTTVLTRDEELYIKNNHTINVCVDPNWYPFEFLNEKKQYDGIFVRFLGLVLDKAGLEANIIHTKTWEQTLIYAKKGHCDIISAIHKTKEREKYLNFTQPYYSYPLMLATKKDTFYINNLSMLKDKKIGIIKDHATMEIFNNKYPDTKIVPVYNTSEGLKKLESNEIFAYIDVLPTIISNIKENGRITLKINRNLDIKIDISIGIKKDNLLLHSILEKTIQTIPTAEKYRLLNETIDIQLNDNTSYKFIFKLLLILLIIILIVLYWNSQLKKKVKNEVLRNIKQESMLHYYSKQESLNDLVGNISHQWKQPLTELSAITMNLETKILLKQNLPKKEFEDSVIRSREIIDFMGSTVDTFNNFYKVRRSDENINLYKTLKEVIYMIKGSLKENRIKINISFSHNIDQLYIKGNPNEIKQVLISIINNAKEVFILRKIAMPIINLNISEIDKHIILELEDNAGGINEKDINIIFEPQFTETKKESSGLGLYISKKIIEDKFRGTISVENNNRGALFKISIPIKEF